MDEIFRRCKAEIGRRLLGGEAGYSLPVILEAVGVELDNSEKQNLHKDLIGMIEDERLGRVAPSGRRSFAVERVLLTDHGRRPEAWES